MGLNVNSDDRILIVAPHPDDESIGCGGVLSLYSGQCDVLLATDGYREDLNNKEASEIRVKEFIAATDSLGVCNRIMLHIPEHKINEHLKDFLAVDFSKYKYVFVPNRYEEHIDHFTLYKVIKKALRKKHSKAELVEYEVWTTIRKPNIKVDISEVVDKKIYAIECHKSQIKDLNYSEMILGLNSYRGKSRGCNYAEMFYSQDENNRKRKKRFKKFLKSIIKDRNIVL